MLCSGQVYRTTLKVGDGTVPAASAALSITKPDGTLVTPAPAPSQSPPGTGNYLYDYLLPSPGLYKFAWTTQGPGTAPFPEYVNVRDFISIVSMAEVKQHLNKRSLTDDDELASYLQAATELVESKVGICVARQFTERVEGPAQAMELVVSNPPVIAPVSVSSIWSGGPTWDASILAASADAGIIYQPGGWAFWWGPWDVVYRAGRQQIAERWQHAAKEQVRHLWETQRGSQAPAVLAGEEVFTATTGWSFSVPRRVLELLEADIVPSI